MSAQRSAGRRPKDVSLTREAVVAAAIGILDESGEPGLTFRLLAERLRSGSGAIHWHVANRDELLDFACDAILAEVETAAAPKAGDELDAIRMLALSLFDTLDRHPWIGAHLPGSPGLPNKLRVLDRIGGLLRSFGVPAARQFSVATAIFTYVLGVAAQMTRNAQAAAPERTRDEWLAEQSTRWAELAPETYPFLHAAAPKLREHDDREQFTTGLDLLLTGIRAEHAA
ncbi:MAG: TetR/AcrR family transcriptional regulator C-terminal domain-containing protein [Microbacterium sp.]